MTLNPVKCQAFITAVLPYRKTLVTVTRRRMYIGPKPINLGPLDVQKYLGHPFKVDGCHTGRVSDLALDWTRLLKAPLQLHQKLDLIKNHLLPRYLFSLQSPAITQICRPRYSKDRQAGFSSAYYLAQPSPLCPDIQGRP